MQGLDQLAEAASAAAPANVPPPSGQSPASTAMATDEDELPSVPSIARRASARAPRSPSLSREVLEGSCTPVDVYWLDWLTYLDKEILHSEVVRSELWTVDKCYAAAKNRAQKALHLRGKGEERRRLRLVRRA